MKADLPISETFFSWQGEGYHMGKAAYFIRLYGCPIQCPWCDSAETWRPDLKPTTIPRMSVEQLASEARAHQPDFVVITGGEPTIYDLRPLTQALHAVDLRCHLETSGAFPIKGDLDWITLSPKKLKLPLQENIGIANELKIIVESANDIEWWLANLGAKVETEHIWLHPEWSKSKDSGVLNHITQWVKSHGAPFRAGWQLHKLYDADAMHSLSQE